MLEGTLKNRDGNLYVVYSTTDYSRPSRTTLWWRVVSSTGNPYTASRPSSGDKATSSGGGGQWSTYGASGPSGGVSTGSGSTHAEFREETEVPPPAARGKELRWQYGQWEKLMAKGWVPAGEGKSVAVTRETRGPAAPKRHHATRKTPAQLDREIAGVLARPAAVKRSIGIPYAQQQRDPKTKTWFSVCPICGMRIALVARKDFESFTGQEYRTHFAKEHPDV